MAIGPTRAHIEKTWLIISRHENNRKLQVTASKVGWRMKLLCKIQVSNESLEFSSKLPGCPEPNFPFGRLRSYPVNMHGWLGQKFLLKMLGRLRLNLLWKRLTDCDQISSEYTLSTRIKFQLQHVGRKWILVPLNWYGCLKLEKSSISVSPKALDKFQSVAMRHVLVLNLLSPQRKGGWGNRTGFCPSWCPEGIFITL